MAVNGTSCSLIWPPLVSLTFLNVLELLFFKNADVVTIKDETSKKMWNLCWYANQIKEQDWPKIPHMHGPQKQGCNKKFQPLILHHHFGGQITLSQKK